MCGRFALARTTDEIVRDLRRVGQRVDETRDLEHSSPRYNVAPTNRTPVFFHDRHINVYYLQGMEFGLLPAFMAKSGTTSRRLLNVREDSIAGAKPKPMYKGLRSKHRVLSRQLGTTSGRNQHPKTKSRPRSFLSARTRN